MKNFRVFVWSFRISIILISALPIFLIFIFKNIQIQIEKSFLKKELLNAKVMTNILKVNREELFNFYLYSSVFLTDTSFKFRKDIWSTGEKMLLGKELIDYRKGNITKTELFLKRGILIEPYRYDTIAVFVLNPETSYISKIRAFDNFYIFSVFLSGVWILGGFVIGFLLSIPYDRLLKKLKEGDIESTDFLRDFLQKEFIEKLEKEKQKKEEFIKITEAIMTEIPRAVAIFDKKGEVVMSNRHFQKLIKHPDFKNVIENIPAKFMEKQIKSGDRILYLKKIPLLKEKIFYFEVEDITEQKKEQEIKEREEKFMLISETMSSFLHEIRNSLSSLNTMVSLIDLKSPELKEKFVPIKDEIKNITESLVYFNDIIKSKKIKNLKKINLKQLVQDVVKEFFRKFADKKIEVSNRTEDIEVEVSPFLLKKAIFNILKNSYDAIDKRGSIEIFSLIEDNIISLIIEDDGSGMKEEEMEKALLPFYTTKETGLGLGLPLVKKVMELHAGEIHLQKKMPRGTRVILKWKKS